MFFLGKIIDTVRLIQTCTVGVTKKQRNIFFIIKEKPHLKDEFVNFQPISVLHVN